MRGRFVATKSGPGDLMKVPAAILSALSVALCLAAAPIRTSAQAPAQAPQAVQRITTVIDNQSLTVLHGNVHPLARAESDQGAVADAQVMRRMLLLLQRSPEQEAALQQLLGDQQNRASGRFQGWLTPQQFGAEFGPSDADVQTVTQWLTSQGFSNVVVGAGRTAIEFLGTAGQVRDAFHTEIRRYAAKGEVHFANASDPAIPAALAPVVAGIVSLNNFPIRSHVRQLGTFQKSLKTGETRPLFTFGGCGVNCYAVGPADFATIYNTQPLLSGSPKIDGTAQGIAIVGESNIHVQDVTDFRTMFGLAQNFSASNVIVNGEDPGINDTEGESDLDVQWSGAVAPGAHIDFVTSASTETTPGINLSALYIVDHNLDAVMSESFGGCETTIGTTFNQFFDSLWEQASAQGITVVISAGDNGSAGCDDFTTQDTATRGLAVSGFASTPYNVAVGGTDFDQANRQSTFWNTTATSTTEPIPASAKSYIPEVPWNDTCAVLGISGCNPSNAQGIAAGSGGVSTLYAKPSWQAGTGVPADGHRDLPDISLFSGNGLNGSFYIVCQSDVTTTTSCNLSDFQFAFQGVGGTSASAPAFAGIMALVNQKLANGSNPTPRQGNANYYLYALAQQQTTANLSCNSSSSPVSGCSFNDVTKGNNDVPCTGASTNCSSRVAATPGVLVTAASPTTPAYTTTAGYDLATGLGSLNAQNVVNKWSSVNTTATTTALTLNSGSAVNITHGQAVPYQISVTPTSANGDASLIATPTGNTIGIGPFTLSGGTVSGTTTQLPGGTSYNIVAHYEGNGTDAPSDSSPVTVNVAAEPSKVLITVPTFNPENGQETGASPTTLVYGSPYILRADVTNASGSLGSLCKPPSCPSGTITFADTIGGVSQGPPNSGTFTLNSSGFTEDLPVQFPGGTNIITATYSGDGSFSASSPATYTLQVTPAPTQTAAVIIASSPTLAGLATTLIATVSSNVQTGAAPGGTVTFYEGTTQLTGNLTLNSVPGSNGENAGLTATLICTVPNQGSQTFTARYSGDANYAASTSPATTAFIKWPAYLTLTPATGSVNYGSSYTVTATVATPGKTPPITGTIQVADPNTTITPTLSVDSNGNQTLTGTFTLTPQSNTPIEVTYSGDANYAGNSAPEFPMVTVPGFNVSLNPSSLAISSGQTVTSVITVTPQSSTSSTVALDCLATGAFGVSCAISPASVNLVNGAPATATLTFVGNGTTSPTVAKSTVNRKSFAIPPVNYRWPKGGGIGAGLALVMLLALPYLRQLRHAFVVGALACAILVVVIGCGGGSSSGGSSSTSSGGGTGPSSTTVTLNLPSKVASNTLLNVTAKVQSSGSLTPTGNVTLSVVNGAGYVPVPLVNGSATIPVIIPAPGIYQMYAVYSGDGSNSPSQTTPVFLDVTGNATFTFTATTGPSSERFPFQLTIQ
jgi:hypothetical protein